MFGTAKGSTGLWTWGCNDACALGRKTDPKKDTEQIYPALVPFFNDKMLMSLSAGDNHMSALDNTGTVYTWGCYRDADGPLGFAKDSDKQLDPTPVTLPCKAVEVVSGENATLALGNNGVVYKWGAVRLNQRTSARNKKKYLEPSPVSSTVRFDRVFSGGMHFFATRKGELYSWGMNNFGQ